jgi:hypothetical protein
MKEAKDGQDFFTGAYEKYGKVYATWSLAMLTSPEGIVANTHELNRKHDHVEHLLQIILVSVLLGASIGALIPDRPPLLSRASIFIVVSFLWLFLSLLIHGICRVLGGKAEMLTTLSLMIQNLAFVYVASNFLTLLISWSALSFAPLGRFLADRMLVNSNGEILFALQFLMLLYLVPVTVSRAHGFRGYRWIVVAIFAACFAVFFGLPVFSMGGC